MHNLPDKKPRFYSANMYFQDTFGAKTYKLALDGGMTCPNRDGTCGTGGCIFCSRGGSGEFAEKQCDNIALQIERAKERVKHKAGSTPRYIAYFQNYTNTYAPVSYLRGLFTSAQEVEDIVGLSIGTRPDCLPHDVLELLQELNQIKPVIVELGMQTASEQTAALIRRGYPLVVYDNAVRELRARGIHVVTHIIFGLPGETREQMLDSVRHAVEAGTDGLKLQLLQVLRGTDLVQMWERGEFDTLPRETYVELVCDAIRIIPPHIVMHRLTGDPPRSLLLMPMWATDKKGVMNDLNRRLLERDIYQGDAL